MRKTSFLLQQIVGFSLIIATVVSLYGYFSFRSSSQVVYNKTTQYMLTSVIQLQGKIDMRMKEYDQIVTTMMFHPTLQEYLTQIAAQSSAKPPFYEIERFLKGQAISFSDQNLFHVTSTDGQTYTTPSNLVLPRTLDEMKSRLGIDTGKKKGGPFWFGTDVTAQGKTTHAIMNLRDIKNLNTLQYIGEIALVFPVRNLELLLDDFNLGESGKVQIIDQFERIVYATDFDKIGQVADDSLIREIRAHKQHMNKLALDQVSKYVVHAVSPYSGWTIVAYVDEADANRDLNKIKWINLLLMIAGIGAAILLTVFFSHTITRPLRILTKRLGKLDSGVAIPERGGMMNKDMMILMESYNDMLRRLQTTVQELADRQNSEKEAILVALKAQFRPHFLYNTLNAIYVTSVLEKNDKVAHMIFTLSELLRYSIHPGMESVTLKEDIEQMQRFVELQKIRYGPKLRIEMSVDPDLLEHKVMKLLLQPLIENAIAHGLEPMKSKIWIIKVVISKQGQFMVFEIDDNGIGLSDQEIYDIMHNQAKDKLDLHTGIGISNLRSRLFHQYGDHQSLTMGRSALGGLHVEIRIALIL